MALICCKECGKEISDTAEVCPNCGRKTEKGVSLATAKFQLVKLIIAAGSFLVGLIIFFLQMGSIHSNDVDDLEEFFEWMDYSDKGFSTFVWLIVGVCLIVCGVINILSIRQVLKAEDDVKSRGSSTETQMQCWRCDCGNVNSDIIRRCTQCGRERQIKKQQSTGAPQGIPTWQRLEMEREAAREKKEEKKE